MIKKTREMAGVKIVYEGFDRGSEMLGIVRNREPNENFLEFDSFNPDGYAGSSWANFKNPQELWDKLQYGINDQELTANTRKLTAKIRTQEKRKLNQMRLDVQGPAMNTSRFVAGDPNCFYNMHYGKTRSKIIDVYVDTRVNGDIDVEDFKRAGMMIAAAIAGVEQMGYRMSISAMGLSAIPECKELVMMSLKVKNEHQGMDMKRLLFPLSDVSFFRGIVFGWRTRLPEMANAWRIGQSAEAYMNEHDVELQDIYDTMLGEGCVTLKLSHIIYMLWEKTEEEVLSYLESRFLGE